MTKTEVAELIQTNFVLYKLGAKPLSDEELKVMLNVWFYHFGKYPAAVVKRAFLAANAVCRYPVQPADIFEQLAQSAPQPNPEAEWQQLLEAVHKAARYTGWRSSPMLVGLDANGRPMKSDGSAELQRTFDGLPQALREYLGGVSALRDLTRLGDGELDWRRNEYMRCRKDAKPDLELLALPMAERPKLKG